FIYAIVGLAAYAIFETFCLNIFGGTFGKKIYGIRLVPTQADRITFPAALKRSFSVWARGLGLGIPLVSFITILVAYFDLKKEGQTPWDRDLHFVVHHRDLSVLRWLLIAFVWLLLLSLYGVVIAAGKS